MGFPRKTKFHRNRVRVSVSGTGKLLVLNKKKKGETKLFRQVVKKVNFKQSFHRFLFVPASGTIRIIHALKRNASLLDLHDINYYMESLGRLNQLWNEWEIRVLVLVSLSLQVFLLATATNRKRVVSVSRATFLWFSYLLADYVAIFALGYLSQTWKTCFGLKQLDPAHHLLVFWAPFLLLHLGGQDTITAFSIEDNELWKRHMLSLVSQVGLAIYVFGKSLPSTKLLPEAVFMFTAGIIKYSERTWALQRASMSSLRSSMVPEPDPGPNYAKFMEQYYSSRAAGLEAKIEVVEESQNENIENPANTASDKDELPYAMAVCKAYHFFQTFKRLFVDLILSFEHRKESQDFFISLKTEKAYKVVEIELSLMYDILHSKAAVIHTWYGWISRGITLSCASIALVLFMSTDINVHDPIDVNVTYVLLGGAVLVEILSIASMLLSFWTYAELKNLRKFDRLANLIFVVLEKFRPEARPRWSSKMAQYNLITCSLKDTPHVLQKTLKTIGLKEFVYNYRFTSYTPVTIELKELVFTELKTKMINITDTESYRRFTNHRGQWALLRKGYYKQLGWSVEAEFDESILLWHIATDLLFHHSDCSEYSNTSQYISNYMLFILVVRPFMLPAGIGQIRFGDTCAEAKNLFQRGKKLDEKKATKMILGVNTEYEPRQVKGDRSKSVLFDGCKLAHQLEDLFIRNEMSGDHRNVTAHAKMWKLISVVWVEILCYAASKCRGNFHARQLSMGGELLTVVWFLMAHLGMGEQYRIEAGHARAKLFVYK